MTHASALSSIKASGIGISSSGGCSNRNNPKCTSLEQVTCVTLNCVKVLKKASGCPITITGGTETGHAGGTYSHSTGYKLDLSLNTCLNNYVTKTFTRIANRGDGSAQYRAGSGNIYAKEGNHWDITYNKAC
ncbi:unnamed protein product [Didymodactylos carnosus]|uniref:Uncharacterized protein n=1 Tax=Didymodactylos carnosus TaxID=1234261 RepID=A0A815L259_9BILA|nr:unnamed protein product [Didymodactylos carnosus]CAF1401099.1 unnamed protein product [Didymodactylos carnosus]CAF4085756.1 unnamed protein product [Didymodactylos carnosus]CAF4294919.1 unnamed protein product [Didymodactylos carnosus]